MESTIKIHNLSLPLSLDKATVIHANKYSKADGAYSYIVFSTLYTEVVFRLSETNEDLRLYMTGLDLPIYTGQEVNVIRVAGIIVGYIDMQSKLYYYTTKDMAKRLGLGIPFYWIWIIGLTGGFATYYFVRTESIFFWIFIPLLAAWLLYGIQKMVYNYRVKKSIDHILR